MKRKVLAWIAANGRGVSLASLALAGFLAFFQTSITVAPAGEIRSLTATPSFVGELTLQRGNHTGTDAGYGLGLPNDRESNDLLRQLRPTLYVQFHPDLRVNAQDVAGVIKPGSTYTLDLWKGQIISIRDENHIIISRLEYEAKVIRRKTLFLYSAIGIAFAAMMVLSIAIALTGKAHSET